MLKNIGTPGRARWLRGFFDVHTVPDFGESICEFVHHLGGMGWAWREAEAFGSSWDGWVVDGLDIDAIFGEQDVGDALGVDGVSDHEGDDMCG